MDENIAGMDVAVGAVGSEGERRSSVLSTAQDDGAVAALAPGQRWSLARKREVVLRLMQGVEGLREVKPLLESLKSTSEAARVTLERAATTMQSAGAAVGPGPAGFSSSSILARDCQDFRVRAVFITPR